VHWNTPAWSLSCEFFFYLCFPIVAVLLCRFRWAPLIAAASIPIALNLAEVPNSWKPLQHLADFLIGIAASGAFDALKRSGRVRGYWLYLPAAVAAVLIVSNPHWTWHWMVLNTALRPFNAVLLVGLALGGGVPVRALSHAASEFLGRASYSMYILHIPILWWYKRTWFTLSGKLTATSSAMIYLAAVIGISAVVCQWFEEPANRIIRRWAGGIVPVPRPQGK
jgi:peptidoglycan/LPS O-acetylase OafA/YrhL